MSLILKTLKSSNPWETLQPVCFLLLVVTLPFPLAWRLIEVQYPGVYIEFTSLNLYLSDIVLLLWLFVAYMGRTHARPASNFSYLLLSLTLLTLVSRFWAYEPYLASLQAIRLIILLPFSYSLLGAQFSDRWIVICVAISLLIQALSGIAQFSIQNDLGLRLVGELDLMTSVGGDSILFANGQYWLRAYGLTPHPNILGGVLTVYILLLLPAYLSDTGWQRWLWLGIICVGLVGLFLSFSRSAWLGGMAGGFSFLLFLMRSGARGMHWQRPLLILILMAALVGAGAGYRYRALLFSRVSPTSNQLETRAVNERLVLAEAGLSLWRDRPFFGIGAANTPVAVAAVLQDIERAGPQPVHNVPLLLGIELGLIGFLLWGAIMFYPMITLWRQPLALPAGVWLIGVTAALIAFAMIDQFDYYAWGWQQGRLLRWLCFGLWARSVGRLADD